MKATLVGAIVIGALVGPAGAKPVKQPALKQRTSQTPAASARDPKKLGAFARVAFSRAGELRPASDKVGRRIEPLTPEEETAAQIQKLLRGPLRRGVTGLFVADARTGNPLFAVNADDPLNPASNVKLISTATALDLLGADFRYPTRLLGPTPVNGVVRGDVYLLGSHDPTLTVADLDDIAGLLVARGITSIAGRIVVGADPTRDGIYRAVVPVEITGGDTGATASVPGGFDFVELKVTATAGRRNRLAYRTDTVVSPTGRQKVQLTIGGTVIPGATFTYPLSTKLRIETAAAGLVSALRAHHITISGELATMELGEFIGGAVAVGALPIELGRHESAPVADIIRRINKWSINWLADRLVMTAAALVERQPPSMTLAVEAMYSWLARHPHIDKAGVVIDTGSGLSYRTQIAPRALVSILRSAGGFVPEDIAPTAAGAWLHSLSVAGADGTLQHRFRGADLRGRVLGKTGTLSTVIALSGIIDVDPQRPLAFSLVTNTDAPLSKTFVRRAHEQVVGEVCKYLTRTAKAAPPVIVPAAPPPTGATPLPEEAVEDPLDVETAGAPAREAKAKPPGPASEPLTPEPVPAPTTSPAPAPVPAPAPPKR